MNLLYKAQTRFLFHAHIKIKISAFYEDDVFGELFAVLQDIDKKYNSYQANSFIDRINKNAGSFVEVDDETIRILKEAIGLSEFFDGEYDITVMPLIRLWGFYKNEQRRIPSLSDIEDVIPSIDYKNIEVDGNRVRIAKGQEIIMGSFIKAYAVDKLAEKMEALGMNDAIINAGGSTIKAINSENHPSWQVVARHPDNEKEMFRLSVSDACYSTSSQAKTFVDIDGNRYGHILSPKTGYPSLNKQVGIVSDNCMVGDIVSTGLFNQTKEGFLTKMNTLSHIYNIEGYLIDKDSNIVYSNGFDKYIISKSL